MNSEKAFSDIETEFIFEKTMNLLELPDDVLIFTILQFLNLPQVLFNFLKVSKRALTLKEKIISIWKVRKITSNLIPFTPRLVVLEHRTPLTSLFYYLDYRLFSIYLKSLTFSSGYWLTAEEAMKFKDNLSRCINLIYLWTSVDFERTEEDMTLPDLPKLRSLRWYGDLAIPKNIAYLMLGNNSVSLSNPFLNLIYLYSPYAYFDLEEIPEFFSRLRGLHLWDNGRCWINKNWAQFLKELKAPDLIYFLFSDNIIAEERFSFRLMTTVSEIFFGRVREFAKRHLKLKYYSCSINFSSQPISSTLTRVVDVDIEFKHYGEYNKIVLSGIDNERRKVNILEERVD